MSDLKSKAYALAEATPPHLGRPTTPPLTWRQEGDELVVILADGRKVRGPIAHVPVIRVSEPIKIPPKAETQLSSTPAPKTASRHKHTSRKA